MLVVVCKSWEYFLLKAFKKNYSLFIYLEWFKKIIFHLIYKANFKRDNISMRSLSDSCGNLSKTQNRQNTLIQIT